jgi:hypothetical protein
MSLHLHLPVQPTRVGSELRNKRSELDDDASDSGSNHLVMQLDFICASPTSVASELSRSWGKTELEHVVMGFGIESVLEISSTRIQRSSCSFSGARDDFHEGMFIGV